MNNDPSVQAIIDLAARERAKEPRLEPRTVRLADTISGTGEPQTGENIESRENETMAEDYKQRVIEHHKVVATADHMMLNALQALCPGYWVMEVSASYNHGDMVDEKFQRYDSPKPLFRVSVTNGDDNVIAQGKTVGSAAAMVIRHLLEGAAFPLGGNGGRYIAAQDRED